MWWLYLLLLLFFCIFLIKATEILVSTLIKISQITGLEKFTLASVIIGLTTTLPELFVSLAAALEGKENLALGNIIGSNIANLSFIVGGATLIGGSLEVSGDFLKKDLLAIFLAALLPLVLISDRSLSRVDGLLLLLIFGIYNYTILFKNVSFRDTTAQSSIFKKLDHKGIQKQMALVFLGAVLLLASADMIVKIAEKLAENLNLPLFLIGLFFIAVGTSLPEFSFQTKAALKKQSSMVFGNLLGSVVTNATFVLGLAAFINPIEIPRFRNFLLATVFFVVIYSLFWVFVRSKRRLERWEALVLIIVYLLFVILEFNKTGGKS